MPFINLPPTVSQYMRDLDSRVRALETAYRFNAPNIDFSTNTPTNPRTGDMYYNTHISQLVYWNGTDWKKLNQANM